MAKQTNPEPTGFEGTDEQDEFMSAEEEDLKLFDNLSDETGATGTSSEDTAIVEPTGPTGDAQTDVAEPTGPTGTDEEATGATETTGPTSSEEKEKTAATAETGPTGTDSSDDDILRLEVTGVTGTQEGTYNWVEAGKKLDIDVKENTEEAYLAGVKEKIDSAKKVVEPNLEKYGDEGKQVFDLLEKGVSLYDIMLPTKRFDDYLVKTTEQQMAEDYFMETKKVDREKAKGLVDEAVADGNFDSIVSEVKSIVNNAKVAAWKESLSKHDEKLKALQDEDKATAQKEAAEMVDYLDKLDNFMGYPLPQETKSILKSQILAGVFQEANNSASVQVKARLFDMFGDKILKKLREQQKVDSRKSYNDGQQRIKDDLHNTKPAKPGSGVPAGKTNQRSDDDSPLGAMRNIDDEVGIETKEEK